MSLYDFRRAIEIWSEEPFYSMIMGAMLRADTNNVERLKSVFPEVHDELTRRYNAPGGLLPEDTDHTEERLHIEEIRGEDAGAFFQKKYDEATE